MRNVELVRKLRRYAEQYRSGETLGRAIEYTEDLLEEAADCLDNLETMFSLMPEGISLEDSSAHVIFNYSQEGDVATQTRYRCPRCRCERLCVRYHEDRLYGVMCHKCRILTLVKAGNPFKAAEIVGGRGNKGV